MARARSRLTADVLREDEDARRRERDAEQRRKVEEKERKKYLKNPLDSSTADYLRRTTKDGTDIIDPSGRSAQIFPSQVANIRTHRFGLGRAHKEQPQVLA